eukprot:m.49161 g.49161  ORF g.49161 m.49161 type:complete len:74 (+) comp10600_c0_seq7:138-359(+)
MEAAGAIQRLIVSWFSKPDVKKPKNDIDVRFICILAYINKFMHSQDSGKNGNAKIPLENEDGATCRRVNGRTQ